MVEKNGMQFAGKKEYVKKVFADIASIYDFMNSVMTFGMVKKWRRFILEQSGLMPGDRVLDVCTGTGELAFLFAEAVGDNGEVTGVDLSPEMLDIARKKLQLLQVQGGPGRRLSFIEGDALSLPFSSGVFDCVTTAFALRNLTDISLAVREMVRVCKKKGRVICLEISEPENPLLRVGFRLYFYQVIPWLGKLAGRGRKINEDFPAYTWLSWSLKGFPQGKEMARIFREAGLRDVSCHPLSGGIVTVYTGEKM